MRPFEKAVEQELQTGAVALPLSWAVEGMMVLAPYRPLALPLRAEMPVKHVVASDQSEQFTNIRNFSAMIRIPSRAPFLSSSSLVFLRLFPTL